MTEKKSRKKHAAEADVVFDGSDQPEDAELVDAEEYAADKLAALKEKLKVCQKERQEYLDGWQRAKADHLNSKRRAEADREQERERQTAKFIEKLLPLCDSFDMALRSMDSATEGARTWHDGVMQIYNQLTRILQSYDVVIITPHGEQFDPHFHEAVSEAPVTEAAQHNIVLEVLQNGYAVGKQLIRPAKVVVGSYQS